MSFSFKIFIIISYLHVVHFIILIVCLKCLLFIVNSSPTTYNILSYIMINYYICNSKYFNHNVIEKLLKYVYKTC